MSRLPERIGRSINELDIDFSRLTVAGWFVSFTSLTLGLVAAFAAYWGVIGKIRDDKGPALIFGLVMIATTVVAFITCRAILSRFTISIIRERPAADGQPLK